MLSALLKNDRMIGGLFKGVFGLLALFVAFVLIVAMAASYQMSGSIMSAPMWILLAGVGVFLATRKRKDGNGAPVQLPQCGIAGVGASKQADSLYQGHGATIEILDESISIKRHGAASFVTQGMKGEKRIFFSSITAIQLKDAGTSIAGYIQFSILGGNESSRGIWDATIDENTVMFTREQSARFHELRERIEHKLAEARRPQIAMAPQSVADELAKLADLRTKGILTEDEFAQQKAAILTR